MSDAEWDSSFDGRAGRFVERIYGSAKGELRLTLLWEDMCAFIPGLGGEGAPLHIWEAGGGAGQIALRLAQRGHRVLLSDVSAQMLALAREQLGTLQERVEIRCASIESLSMELTETFPVIVCHAVLEWLPQPRAALAQLVRRLAPGGYLSLMFYNRNSLLLTHALHGNVKKLRAGDLRGHPGGLTPPQPLAPETVADWLAELPLDTLSRCGIRSVSEYLPDSPRFDSELVLALERQYQREAPFLQLARYQHWVCRRRPESAPACG